MKDLFSWSDKLSVTVDSIDEQHKELVRMVNELNAAMGEGRANDVIGKILKDLIAYTVTHFKHEETLMNTHAYPGFAKHKKEHENLVEKVLALQSKFEAGQARMNIEVMLFLKNWLTAHIQGTDKELGVFLSSTQAA